MHSVCRWSPLDLSAHHSVWETVMLYDSITDIDGIEVGYAHDSAALTGCHVVLCRQGAVVGVDVRGSAPGTRETDLCRSGTLVTQAHAVVLTGGSAFGLDAASGVMRWLWERDIGFDAGAIRVPIVPAAVIFDLGLLHARWPDAAMGYAACDRGSRGRIAQGSIGAGIGASVGKLYGLEGAMKSGMGTASRVVDRFRVSALMVVNAFGDVLDPTSGLILAGARNLADGGFADTSRVLVGGEAPRSRPSTNTTIGVVATDAALDPDQCNHVARVSHDGLARVIRPVHTMFDGDTIFSLATGTAPTASTRELVTLAVAAVDCVERAVANAIRHATPAGGLPALSE